MKNLKTLVESQFPLLGRGLGRGGDKKSAFTLAEVLITLGVIGVVASITLPTLIKEYNKHAWVNALKENWIFRCPHRSGSGQQCGIPFENSFRQF